MIDTQIKPNRIFGLDVMRAVAILMVLCSHILWIYPPNDGILSQLFTLFGFWGVEIFFVLSGFLIGKILYTLYYKNDFTYHSVFYFLKRRWFRTLPNYFLILLLNAIIAIVFAITVSNIGWYFFFFQNFATTMTPFFPESWSLSVEEYTYLVVPLSLLVFSFFSKQKRFISVILFLMLLFLITKIAYNSTTHNTTLTQWNVSLKSVVIYRIDSILIGITMAWLSLNYTVFWQKQKINLAFLAAFLMLFMLLGIPFFKMTIADNPFFWNVCYLPLNSLIFALFLPLFSQWKIAPNWILKPITFVSIVSYSVYLLHYSIVLQLMKYAIDTTTLSIIQLHVFTLVYVAITVILSWILFRYFEKPMMNLRDK